MARLPPSNIMKTDRFSDSIRRKLESIRPEFNEKDWARMQASLQQAAPVPAPGSPVVHQPFTGSAWSAQPWLMAAAAVSTVVLISVAVWQRSQINDLRSQLSAKQPATIVHPVPSPAGSDAPALSVHEQTSPVAIPADGQADLLAGRAPTAAPRPDTVFITRYITVPSPSGTSQNRVAQRPADEPNTGQPSVTDRNQPLVRNTDSQRSVTRSSTPDQGGEARPNSLPATEPTTDESITPVESATRSDRRVAGTSQAASAPEEATSTTITPTGNAGATNSRPASESRSTRQANERSATPFRTSRTNGVASRGNRSSAAGAYTGSSGSATGTMAGDNPVQPNDAGVSVDASSSQPAVAYETVTSRPLTLGTIDWKSPLAYRARRIRPTRTTIVGGTAAPTAHPASQSVNQLAIGYRLGAGLDVMNKLVSGSVLGEVVIGKHLRVSTGIGLASFAGGRFGSDEEFDKNNHQNFRRDYVRGGIDPRNQLMNIGIHTEIVQIPLSVGYRIPLNKSFSLLPSVGTTFNLQSREHVTFEYRPPFFRTTETASYQISRPIDLVNSLSLGAGLEWARNHWVGQAGPVMNLSARSTVNWQDGACVGLRARVFYQF